MKLDLRPLLGQPTKGAGAIIFDTETHDRKAPKIVEAAYAQFNPDSGELNVDAIYEQRFDPGVPITFGAMSTHHILPADIVGMPSADTFQLPDWVGYVIGHNIEFDLEAIGNPQGIRAIDTLALARRAWPDLDSYTQSALFYKLHSDHNLDLAHARNFLRSAHSAGTDIKICGFIAMHLLLALAPMLEKLNTLSTEPLSKLDALHCLSLATKVPLLMTFGKHEGEPAHLVPYSYKSWYTKTETPDPMVLLAMSEGGSTPEGKAQYGLARQLFETGHKPMQKDSGGGTSTPAPHGVQPLFQESTPARPAFSFARRMAR